MHKMMLTIYTLDLFKVNGVSGDGSILTGYKSKLSNLSDEIMNIQLSSPSNAANNECSSSHTHPPQQRTCSLNIQNKITIINHC